MAGGKRLPQRQSEPVPITIAEILDGSAECSDGYHVDAEGKKTPEHGHFESLMRIIRRPYGRTPAVQFGPPRPPQRAGRDDQRQVGSDQTFTWS